MSDELEPGPEPSIGRYLARQRSMRGISVEELAASTRIPQRSLERLESGAFDLAPDGFTRGFVRTVAEALGLDPEATVMRMLHEPGNEQAAKARAARLPWIALAVVLLGIAVTAAGFGLWRLGAALRSEPGAPDAAELVYRRDAVRALAAADPSLPDPALAAADPSAPLAPEVTAGTPPGPAPPAPDPVDR